jgi:hypothetical protein
MSQKLEKSKKEKKKKQEKKQAKKEEKLRKKAEKYYGQAAWHREKAIRLIFKADQILKTNGFL